ncbi:unnamed protein product [Protopolystoma xenopodis]|uniref:Phosphagen kinase C-terminal domain-containing protein n=1 Tax=Protopolystoma xenopodis TaxID=117903 RepID=A0A448X3I2_9PLAT|nr:unnamed protein product [Protopolystoma xenopodis]
MKATQFSVIEDRIVKALRKYNDEAGAYYPLSEFRKTEPSLYRQLVKKRLIIPNRLQSRRASGVYRHWPRGRGLYLFAEASDESNLVVQVNSDDHLKVISVDWTGENPERAYTRAVRIMRHLDASGLRFSRHPRYGYVSPCIWSLGSGLRFSGLVKLPGLAKRKKEELERLCNTHMLTIRPGLGIGIPVVNAIYDVGSRCCLGRGEDELIFSVMEGVAAQQIWSIQYSVMYPSNVFDKPGLLYDLGNQYYSSRSTTRLYHRLFATVVFTP